MLPGPRQMQSARVRHSNPYEKRFDWRRAWSLKQRFLAKRA